MNKICLNGLVLAFGVLLTLSSSNLVFLHFLGPIQAVVTTSSVGLLVILLVGGSLGLKQVRRPSIDFTGLYLGLTGSLLLCILISLLLWPVNGNAPFAFRDGLWLVVVALVSLARVRRQALLQILIISYWLCSLSLVALTYYSFVGSMSYADVNLLVYGDDELATLRDFEAIEERARFNFPGQNSNTTGTILTLLAFAKFILLKEKNGFKNFIVSALVASIFIIFALATLSKTVLVLLFIFTGICIFFGQLRLSSGFFLAAAGIGLMWLIDPVIFYRLVSVYDLLSGSAMADEFIGRTSNRSESIATSAEILFTYPLGIGYEKYASIAYSAFGGGEHNNFLYMSILYGLPFGFLWALLFCSVLIESIGLAVRAKMLSDEFKVDFALRVVGIVFASAALLVQFVAPTPVYCMILLAFCVLLNRSQRVR